MALMRGQVALKYGLLGLMPRNNHRDKFHQKVIDHVEKYDYSERKQEKPKKEPKALFHMHPIDLTVSYVLQLCSIAFLGVLITYLWGGGLQGDLFRYNANRG